MQWEGYKENMETDVFSPVGFGVGKGHMMLGLD